MDTVATNVQKYPIYKYGIVTRAVYIIERSTKTIKHWKRPLLFATYKRPNETPEFRDAFNDAKRVFLSDGCWSNFDSKLANIQNQFPESRLHIETCRTLAALYSCSDPEFTVNATERLADTLISGITLNPRENDIHHDAYSILLGSTLDKAHQAASILKDAAGTTDLFSNLLATHESGAEAQPPRQFEFCIPRTGFFSFLEQLCLATFAAKHFNIKVNINLANWMFPNSIAHMLPSMGGQITYRSKWYVSKKTGRRNLNTIRQNLLGSPPIRHEFALWKQSYYRYFLDASLSYLHDNRPDIDLTAAHSTVMFLRFGDKVAAETFPIHPDVLSRSMSTFKRCTILSDDQSFVDTLLSKAPESLHNTIYGRHISGYNFNKSSHDVAGFEDVLVKWSTMAKAETLYSDCNTNIANAAFAASSAMEYKPNSPIAIFRPTLLI